MRTTGHNANTPSVSKTGIFAKLRGLLRTQGTSAPSSRAAGFSLGGVLVLASLAFTAAPALASAPEAPKVSALEVHATEALLLGILNPNAVAPGQPGTYQFVYRPSTKKECKGAGEVKTPASPGISLGGEREELPYESVAGLTAGTEYAVCLVLTETGKTESTVSAPIAFTTAIPPETPQASKAEPVTGATATLHGVVNPQAAGNPGSYEYVYRKSASECEHEGVVESSTGPIEAHGGKGEAAPAQLTGLTPSTTYTFCLLAHNEVGEVSALSAPETFTTLTEAPKVAAQYVTDVKSSSATFHAQLNPEGADTTYHFEYDTVPYGAGEGPHGTVTPTEDAGAGTSTAAVEAHVQGLTPATTYYYRVVAHNSFGGGGGSTVPGGEETFATQQAGGEFALPDNRTWELVTPPNKHGATIESISKLGGVVQASENGSAITYLANAPLVREPAGNPAPTLSQLISSRGTAGWGTQNIATPNYEVSELVLGSLSEYRMFSGDLSSGIAVPENETPLPPLAAGAERTIYLRDNPTNSYQGLVTAANVLPGAKFGRTVRFEGASPDARHAVVNSVAALTPAEGSTPRAVEVAGERNLYEWTGGRLRLVSVLPNGEQAARAGYSAQLGYSQELTRDAVSDDGTRVVWTGGGENKHSSSLEHLFVRDMNREETVQLDVPEQGASGEESLPIFRGASSDGSEIFFTDNEPLTSTSSIGDLYVAELSSSGPLAATLTDLTVDENPSEAAGFQGNLIGYSEVGSDVYFVASGKLAQGATAGAPNLYVEHLDGTSWARPRLIATLAGEDAPTWGIAQATSRELGALTARVSPSGRYLAFMSSMPLTGYDNHDASGGANDEEVFLYDADTGRLACASCNPTGARPQGVFDKGFIELEPPLLYDGQEVWSGHSLAGNVPGWTPFFQERATYQSRYLSNAGRLFFDSSDSLVPSDLNHQGDVYEYEPEGRTCDGETQSASEVYKLPHTYEVEGKKGEESAGCVGLISSGTSSQESAFLDASAQGPGGEEGEDVFFMTASQLSPQDSDSAYDIYDAHQCPATSSCPTGAAGIAPACTNADSCRAAPGAQPSIYGAPSSATFSGAGNTTPSATVPKKTTKKTVKCKKNFVKNKRGKCIKRPKKKAKRPNGNRRTHS